MNHTKGKRSSWGGKVKSLVSDSEKNNYLSQRAETLLHSLRVRFPGLPQTALDMNKIEYNKVFCTNSLYGNINKTTKNTSMDLIACIYLTMWPNKCDLVVP